MKKRIFCLLLSALVILSLLPQPRASAAYDQKTSEKAITILKELEGFIKKPIADNGQYSVGYGSGCNKNDYPNGITEEQADALLREYLVDMEKSVNYFARRYSMQLSQHQFDALMLFTYNVGANWINADGEFRQALIAGKKGNDFLYPFTLWSNASSEVQLTLVKRRLAEASMYLNGTYSVTAPPNYTYVLFDKCGGVCDVKVQGYNANTPVAPKPIPVRTGYRFMGWYTAEEGGQWIRELNVSTAALKLYAHWQEGNGDRTNGSPVSYQITTRNLASGDVHKNPGGTVTRRISGAQTLTIVADYVDAGGVKWGKLSDGGWVNMGNAIVGVVTPVIEDPVTVTVNTNGVNVRSAPGSYSTKTGTVNKGDTLTILETRMLSSNKWGRYSGGWINLMYTNYDAALEDMIQEENTVTGYGRVVNCSALRIRSGAGDEYPVVGSLNAGDQVMITQQKTVNGTTWGKISSGWISMSYIQLYTGDVPEQMVPEIKPEETEPEETEPEEETPEQTELEISPTEPEETEPEETLRLTGVISTSCALRIREDAGTEHDWVGYYSPGDQVTITEVKKANGESWGKTDKGWICLTYVKLDQKLPESDGNDSGQQEGTAVTGKIISTSALRIRSGAGTQYDRIGCYDPGTRVTIVASKTVNGEAWGKTDKGWICLTYVQLDQKLPEPEETKPEETEPEETKPEDTKPEETVPETKPEDEPASISGKGTVKGNGVRIRSAAGTNSRVLAYYFWGNRVEILETATANGMLWGRTDKGWVSMDYVTMDKPQTVPGEQPEQTPPTTEPEESKPEETKPQEKPDTEAYWGTVNADGVRIRSAAGTASRVLAYYFRGNRVQILETANANGMNWGKTAKGWICLDYVTADKVTDNAGNNQQTGTVTGTVVGCEALSVRSGAGIAYPKLDTYPKGTVVTIYEQTTVGGQKWGRTDMGWISLAYVQIGANQPEQNMPVVPETQPEDNTGFQAYKGTVNADGVRIRTGAGTENRVVAYYFKGNRVEILETKESGGREWGRTVHGWISLEFVDKDK